MNDRELRRLNRKDLLELLIEQTKKTAELQNRVKQLELKLEEKQLNVSESGTLAEAALRISNVFSDADKAAELYLENIRTNEAESSRILDEAKTKAEEILQDAEQTRLKKLLDEANQYMEKVKNAIKRFLSEHPEIKIKIKD